MAEQSDPFFVDLGLQREKFGRRLCVVGKVESGGIRQLDGFSLRLSRTAVIEAQNGNAVPG